MLVRLRGHAAAGRLVLPHFQTGVGVNATHQSDTGLVLKTPAELRRAVAAIKAAGFDFIKLRDQKPAEYMAVVAAARDVGLPVIAHYPQGATLNQALAMDCAPSSTPCGFRSCC